MYKRHIENHIKKLLEQFPAVAILGARQVGKTTLAKTLSPQAQYFDLERAADFELLQDPELTLQSNSCYIIDEAQRSPELFLALRGIIDANRSKKGRFILTGSSSPALHKQLSESLAGRVAVIELGSLKASEAAQIELSPFYKLFSSLITREQLEHFTKSELTYAQLRQHWLFGGYPEPQQWLNEPERFEQWMAAYQDSYIHRDIKQLFPSLSDIAYRRFIGTLANLSGTIINKSALARAIEISEKSVRNYFDIAAGTFLWQPIQAFEHSALKSLVKMPKGFICDSGLLHYLLRIDNETQLLQSPLVGHSFEGFVINEIIKGLRAQGIVNWQASYFRTQKGSEVDLILEGRFGLLPIEIKYGSHTPRKQLKHLESFIDQHDCEFGLIINQSDRACWLSKNVFQLPATYL